MKAFRLTLVTKNQKQRAKATSLAELVLKTLSINTKPVISDYYKFDDSFKIEIISQKPEGEESVKYLI